MPEKEGRVKLNYRTYGDSGEPLVILHGLFGSSNNWQSVARELSSQMRVVTPDLRNHGRSPWGEAADYRSMTEDVVELITELPFAAASIMGHSMGGKIAMLAALTRPELVERIIVVDIAPKEYPPFHRGILDALLSLDTGAIESREEADAALKERIPYPDVRAFLLTNLVKRNGGYEWRLNLEALSRDYGDIAGWPDERYRPFAGPALFISGSESAYVQQQDREEIKRLFPEASFETLQGASHWLHVEEPDAFLDAVRLFLSHVR